jgi:hypothetical protein
MNALIDIEKIKKSAESSEMFGGKVERIGSPSIGDVVRQGDLYLVCIERVVGVKTERRQLAPGTTQGSRHVISGDCNIVAKYGKEIANVPEELIGPAFTCVGECTVEHPEHGHKILPSATSWAVVYQRAYADEVRRVQD